MSPWLRLRRQARSALWRRPAPPNITLVAAAPKAHWVAYFVFLPNGQLSNEHRYTLERLKASCASALVVCATPHPDVVPLELRGHCDALIWKSLDGYDFSGYSIALWHIAQHSPGASVMVMNDSIFGPLTGIDQLLLAAPWGITGFTASSLVQNHIQSYAFIIRDVTPARMSALPMPFPRDYAYNRAGKVIFCQELTFAASAYRHMTAGALWFGKPEVVDDPTLQRPEELLLAGFPFLKQLGQQLSAPLGLENEPHRRN